MSKTLQEIFVTNPITSNAPTDLMYFVQSPYTPGTDAGMVFSNFAAQFGAPYTPSALTRTNDTNVTLTLGGFPTVALLAATSMTLGWTGLLSATRGGTGVNNGTNTVTFGGNLSFANSFTTSGNFSVTQTYTGITNVTFPTSGTLATVSQIPSVTPSALTEVNDTNVTMTLGGSPSTALLQATSMTLGWTGQLSVLRGGTGSASVIAAPTISSWAGWDANKNLSANNFLSGYTTTVTAAGNTTLTVASTYQQFFTGSTTQTVIMPGTNTLVLGQSWYFVNNSSGSITILSSGGGTIVTMAANTTALITCISTSGTTPASWSFQYQQANLSLPLSLANGGTNAALTASNGGIFYSTASAGAILSGTATAGLALLSGASTTPKWSSSPPFTRLNVQIFTGSGTYTPTSGMVYAMVESVGQGAGGGGCANAGATGSCSGGGGGAGSYSRKLLTAATIGASQTITIANTGGAGGVAGNNGGTAGSDASFGTLCIGKGGTGGQGAASNAGANGGAGGVAGTGDFTAVGNGGTAGNGGAINTITITTGHGGASVFGGAPASKEGNAGNAGTGAAGTNYGAGGDGGVSFSASGAAAGGAGSGGVIIVTEYISI